MELNDGHYHEAMDRLHVICENIDSHVKDHPAIIDVEANNEIDEALSILMDVYRRVGEKDPT